MIKAKYYQICDVCGHERELTRSQFELIKSNHLDKNIVFYIDTTEMRDICPNCYNKISEILKNANERNDK